MVNVSLVWMFPFGGCQLGINIWGVPFVYQVFQSNTHFLYGFCERAWAWENALSGIRSQPVLRHPQVVPNTLYLDALDSSVGNGCSSEVQPRVGCGASALAAREKGIQGYLAHKTPLPP